MRKNAQYSLTVPLTLLVAIACSESGDSTPGNEPGGTATGGTSVVSGSSTGGLGTGGFGTGGPGTGGLATGGVSIATGGQATGGVSIATGGVSTGGVATGGQATGGVSIATGGVSTGGVATGGQATGGQATGGWSWSMGGVATGGQATGGQATGGQATGGQATGGQATGGTPSTCTEADVTVCASNDTSKVAKHCGLTYEIWSQKAEGCMTNTPYGFKTKWTKDTFNHLARKGVRPGSADPVVTFDVDYKPDGNSYIAIYGWTENPLIEYYIVDGWGNWRPPGNNAEHKGEVTVDGATYDVYKTRRTNQPSIKGNATFDQFWSVRKEKRTKGTITVGPHFEAWKSYGLQLGTFYEVSLVIEGYDSGGEADVRVSFK